MSAAPSLVGMVVEGPDDARTVPSLVDRIIEHRNPGVDGRLERIRAFVGLDASKAWLAWSAIHDEATRRRVPRRHGHFGGEPAAEDARAAWYALQCFVGRDSQPTAVLLVRDSDGKQEERARGLEQARRDCDWPFPVLVGVAHTMRECWVLAAFIPASKGERAAWRALRQELGFDPTVRSERLNASKESAKKSPKDVLSKLIGRDKEREALGWAETDLEHLRERGAKNGLASFMSEVEERLVPALATDCP